MKLSTIFRKAARLVELGRARYSCRAVSIVAIAAGEDFYFPRITYQRLIAPEGRQHLLPSDFGDGFGPTVQNHRVLALCMAATLAEEEGL